ncbi:FtsW/RodA/SpoVE family cell cycle protein [Schinkia azotoformans]|uniref:FtsW/RodA/SpoVE family cell cycle protein n=1 Tax=Schinkia azotoformans TaxID=1454 RepID=UPI002DB82364|nr:FtsW/RodA/SpoVE family cell cycle protein [Schinkia azotoformans]MEC1721044.1 FtsW/RodA/SpoVE family cell cycle protein [Schinkia azotoformans]MED4412295.1 FtsW/RodA/SpoVE family cell cycle protein [Schinkia azotoformans]
MVKKMLRSYDYTLVLAPIILSLFGLIMIYSSSMVVAVSDKYEGTPDLFFMKQLKWLFLGIFVYIIALVFPYKAYKRLLKLIFFGAPIILLGVLLFGTTTNNATRGFLGIQPAEFIKLGVIIYLAGVFSNKQSYIERFVPAFGPPLTFIIIIFLLVYKQPDLGTALLILATSGMIIFCSGIRPKHLSRLILVAVVGVMLLYPFLSDEQLGRIEAAYNPFHEDIADSNGYQLINSYIAIAAGGVTGEGLGKSIQKFGYLPEPHTDFIMAVISEELGIFGVGFVLFMLLLMIWKGFTVAMKANDPFGSLIAIGISGMIGIQSIVNLGALTGLLPITGVPLPFVSYGGSSLVILMISMGILNNIAMYSRLKGSEKQNNEEKKIAYL